MRAPRLVFLVYLFTLLSCGPATVTDYKHEPVGNDVPLARWQDLDAGVPAPASLPAPSSFTDLPPKVTFVYQQSPVRDQGERGTCSVFATLGLMEQLYRKDGHWTHVVFSPEYLQWLVKKQAGLDSHVEGSTGGANMAAIAQYGVVVDEVDPYQKKPWGPAQDPACVQDADGNLPDGLPTQCYTNGEPPPAALSAQKFFLPAGHWINPGPDSIKTWLATNHTGVIVGVKYFLQSWNHATSTLPISANNWHNGIVLYPNDADKALADGSGHAVLVVGYDDTLTVPIRDAAGHYVLDTAGHAVTEKGFYLIKNSWGTGSFGVNNPYGPGYGFLSERYVAEYGWAYAGEMPASVPPAPNQQVITATNQTAAAIPDNDAAGVQSKITLAQTGVVRGATITVDITHPYRGDLKIELLRGGKDVVLQDQQGADADDVHTSFPVPDFDGSAMTGDWIVKVSDLAADDAGTLHSWKLEVLTDAP
jgi:hypothetical protein